MVVWTSWMMRWIYWRLFKADKKNNGRWLYTQMFFPIALAQLSPVRHSKLSGAKQQISSCCALSKVTEFLPNGEIGGEIAALWLHAACVMTSDICSEKLWSIGFGVNCWRALRCVSKHGLTAYQVKFGLAWSRKFAFPHASPLRTVLISFPFLGEEDGKSCERKTNPFIFFW